MQVTEETERKKQELFESFPCMHLKYRHRAHQNQLNEITFSESFVKSLGYSVEEFAEIVLLEGIPQ